MSLDKLFTADELNIHTLSYLDPASLQRAAMMNKSMHHIAMDPALWREFLVEGLKGESADPRMDVINAIKAKDYLKLAPECLLRMLYANTIRIEEFVAVRGALSQKQDQVSRKITNLIDEFNYIFIQKHFTNADFTGLNVKQIEVIINYYRHTMTYGKETHLKPQDFIALNAEQLHATVMYNHNSAEQFFKAINLKPQDFAALTAQQIKAITSYCGNSTLNFFETGKIKPQDFAILTPEQIATTIPYRDSPDQLFTTCGIIPQDISKFSPAGIRFLLSVRFNTKQLQDTITNPPEKYSHLLQTGTQWMTQEQIKATSHHDGQKLFNECALTAQDLAKLTPKQIEVASPYAEKLFITHQLKTQDLAKFSPAGIRFLCHYKHSMEQFKEIVANAHNQYARLLAPTTPLDFNGLTLEQIKAFKGMWGNDNPFDECSLNPQDFKEFSPALIAIIAERDNAEKLFVQLPFLPQDFKDFSPQKMYPILSQTDFLFIKCSLQPQDILILTHEQIIALLRPSDAENFFTKYQFTTQDLVKFSHNGIKFLLNSRFSKDELKAIIDNPSEQYARLLKDAYYGDITGLTPEQIEVITKDPIILRLFIECKLTIQDLVTLSPQQIEAMAHSNAYMFFSKSGLEPKALSKFNPAGIKFLLESKLDIDQLKVIITNPKGQYARLLTKAEELDFSGLTEEQIKAFAMWDGSNKLFIQCNLNPQNFKEFTSEQIIKITWSDNAERLFIKCGLKPEDITILNDKQIEAILMHGNAEKLFIQCHLNPQDIIMLNGEQIQYIINYDTIESFIQHGLKPECFAQFSIWGIKFLLTSQFSTEQLQSIIDSPHAEHSRLLKNANLNDFTGLNPEQIEAIKGRDNTYLFFIQCELKPQDFVMLTAEQIKATQYHFRSAEAVFMRCKLKPEDFVALTPEQILAVTNSAEMLFGICGLKPKDFVELTLDLTKAVTHYSNSAEMLFAKTGFKPQDYAVLTAEQILAVTGGAERLFTKTGFKPKDYAVLTAEQILAVTGGAERLFTKTGFKPKDFVELTIDQTKAINHYGNSAEMLFAKTGLKPQDYAALTAEQIVAVTGGAERLFTKTGLKPQDIGKFTPAGIKFLCKAGFDTKQLQDIITSPPEKYSHLLQNGTQCLTQEQIDATSRGAELLFNKCALTASDLVPLTPQQIEAVASGNNSEKLFIKCKLTTKDITKLSPAGIRFLCDSTTLSIEQLKDIIANPQAEYARLLLDSPPIDLGAFSMDQINALERSSGAAEKLFIRCKLTPQDVAQLSPKQIEIITWSSEAETLFIKCGLKPQDIVQFSNEQLEIIARSNNAETLFIKCKLTPQDVAIFTCQQISTFARYDRDAERFFTKYKCTTQDLANVTPDGIKLLLSDPKSILTPDGIKLLLSDPRSILTLIPDTFFTPEYIASIKTQDGVLDIHPIQVLVMGDAHVVDFLDVVI